MVGCEDGVRKRSTASQDQKPLGKMLLGRGLDREVGIRVRVQMYLLYACLSLQVRESPDTGIQPQTAFSLSTSLSAVVQVGALLTLFVLQTYKPGWLKASSGWMRLNSCPSLMMSQWDIPSVKRDT